MNYRSHRLHKDVQNNYVLSRLQGRGIKMLHIWGGEVAAEEVGVVPGERG